MPVIINEAAGSPFSKTQSLVGKAERGELPRTPSPKCGVWLKPGVPEPQGTSHIPRGQEPEAVASEALCEVPPQGQFLRERGGQGEPQNQDPGKGWLPGLLPRIRPPRPADIRVAQNTHWAARGP